MPTPKPCAVPWCVALATTGPYCAVHADHVEHRTVTPPSVIAGHEAEDAELCGELFGPDSFDGSDY